MKTNDSGVMAGGSRKGVGLEEKREGLDRLCRGLRGDCERNGLWCEWKKANGVKDNGEGVGRRPRREWLELKDQWPKES